MPVTSLEYGSARKISDDCCGYSCRIIFCHWSWYYYYVCIYGLRWAGPFIGIYEDDPAQKAEYEDDLVYTYGKKKADVANVTRNGAIM